ncbi:DUF7282 domain-containing protein [Halorarum halobium]|uniref:DUF7282 domain-containing protein n=1 Tax=Halorarum halobium TaxID=3075121 RepID=UPI0028B251F5|nr:right-handed parallel beta-helix repeat-containing protein [Halobaculum sp. XH14]
MASNDYFAGAPRFVAVLVGVALLTVLAVGSVESVAVAGGAGTGAGAPSVQQQDAATAGVERGAELARERGANVSQSAVDAAAEAAAEAAAAHPDANPDRIRSAATGAAHGAFLQAQTAETTQIQAVVGGSVRGALEQQQDATATQVRSAAYGAAHGSLAQRQQVTAAQLQSVAAGAASGAAASAAQKQVTDVGQIQEAAQGAAYGAISQRQQVTVEQLQAAAYGGAHGALDRHEETDLKQVQVAAIGGARGALKGAVSQRQSVTVEQIQSAAMGGASGALFQAQRVTVEQIQIAAEGAARGACERAARRQVVDVEQVQSAARGAAHGALTQAQAVSVTQIQRAARGAAGGALEQYQSASVEQLQFAARGAARGAVSTQRTDVRQVQRAASGAATGALQQAQSATVEQVQYAARGASAGVLAQRQSVELKQAQAAAFGAADGAVGRAVQRQSVDVELVQYAAHGAAEGALAQRTRITVEQTQSIASGAADGALRQVQRVTVEQVQRAASGAASGAATSASQRTEVTVEQLQAAASGAAEGSLTQVQRVSIVQIQAAASGAARGALVQYTQVSVEQIQSAALGAAAGGVQIQQVTIVQIQVVTRSAASGALSQSVTASAVQIRGAAEGACRGILRQSGELTIRQSQYLGWLESAGAAQSAASEGITDVSQIVRNAESASSNASAPEDEFEADVSFEDQDSDGTTVTIDSVTLPEGGFVAVRNDELDESDPLDVVGVSSYLEAGTHDNVTVELFDVAGREFDESALTADRTLSAVPHFDTDGDEEFTYVESAGDADEPYVEDGAPAGDDAEISIDQANLTARLNVSDQPAADTVVVDDATLSAGGFVAIHSDEFSPEDVEAGTLRDGILGVSEYVEPGADGELTVELNESVNGSTTVFAVAYRDTDGDGEFEYVDSGGEVDAPYLEDELPVFEQVELLGPDTNETQNVTDDGPTDATADASLEVGNQTDDGTTLTVENASATTEFAVTVDRNGTVLNESEPVAANGTFAGPLVLDPPLGGNATLTVAVVDAGNGSELATETISYTVAETTDAEPNATVSFGNQTTNGTAVTVDSVTLPDGGFVAIRDATGGDDGAGLIIGVSAYLDAGTSGNVSVELTDPLTENRSLLAVAYRDADGNGTLDVPVTNDSADGPYLDAGEPVTDEAFVTVLGTETADNETAANETDGVETPNETAAGVTELDACGVIDEPGRYVLTANVTDSEASSCVTINASDVVLDGDGHALDGVGTNGSVGVWIRQSDGEDTENVTVRDVVATDWGTGIGQPEFESGNLVGVSVVDATVSENEYGIYLTDANGATVSDSIVRENAFHGVILRDFGASAVLSDNVIRSNGESGLTLFEGGSGAQVTGNLIENNAGVGIDTNNDVNDLEITDNHISGNADDGLDLDESDGVTVRDNTVSDNAEHGIDGQDLADLTVAGNVIEGNDGDGIALVSVAGALLDNRVSNSGGADLSTATISSGDLSVSNLSLTSATVGFDEGRNVALDAVESPPEDPENATNVGEYVAVNATDDDASVALRVQYSEDALETANLTAASLRLWQYQDATGWTPLTGPNASEGSTNVVTATVTSSGIVAPLGTTARPAAEPNATLVVADQVGNGTALTVGNATATVEYVVTASEGGRVLGETDSLPANESFAGNITLDPPIEANATVDVAVVDADTGAELTAATVEYTVEAAEPLESVDATVVNGTVELENPNDVAVLVTVTDGDGELRTVTVGPGATGTVADLQPGDYTVTAETEDGTSVPVNGQSEATVTIEAVETPAGTGTTTTAPGTPTATDSPTATESPTPTDSPTPTEAPTPTESPTPAATPTEQPTPEPTESPVETATPDPTDGEPAVGTSLDGDRELPLVAGIALVAVAPLLGRRR